MTVTAVSVWKRCAAVAVALVALLGLAAPAQAAVPTPESATVTVAVTMVVGYNINIHFGNIDGSNPQLTQAWAVGTIVRNGVYVSNVDGSYPLQEYIQNESNYWVDISVSCSNSYSWTVGPNVGTNIFKMEARVNGGLHSNAYVSVDTPVFDHINNLASTGLLGPGHVDAAARILLRLSAPSDITRGAGLQQSITVTYTASADNGD